MRGLAGSHTLHPQTDIRAWLKRVMRNAFLTSVIRRKRAGRAVETLAVLRPIATEADGEVRLLVRDVSRAFSALSPRQREVLTLVAVEGLSYQLAAQIMGCSTEAVRSHLARGRAELRFSVRLSRNSKSTAQPAPAENDVNGARQRLIKVVETTMLLLLIGLTLP